MLRSVNIKVTGFARGNYPELEQMGVVMIRGDICDLKFLTAAMQSCDLVFHVASKAGIWGNKNEYYRPNVDGVANIIQACKTLSIKHIVYTSTPSVTFAGIDEEGIDESQPYAEKFLNYYAESKAIAEQMMLNANSEQLKTVALRPHLIWGPEDPHLISRVIERGKAGGLKLLGKTDKLVDTVYVDNAAYAHVLAGVNIVKADTNCAGKSYFISNDQPITMANMLNKILACVDLPPVTKRVPVVFAYAAGALLEWVHHLLAKKEEPMMTRFVARQLSTSHYFNIEAAKKDLGYQPLINIEQGMQRLKASLSTSSMQDK
jgi:nucleoside-diphosphate-sugar epimerase